MPRLEEGFILHSKEDQYRIIRYLGEGLTAIVYEAERLSAVYNPAYKVGCSVAVKVLMEGLPEDIQLNFRNEADIITTLSAEETAAGITPSLIPGLVERYTESGNGPQFLAMEFVKGAALDRRIREEGPFPEKLGLEIAGKVLTILDLLHSKLKKTYTDFQLQNIWLLPDGHSIKIMDWNHVSDKRDPLPAALVDADLRRMGAYLYQMLTGKGAFQTGETGEALAGRAGTIWADDLSIGARHLIRKALDPNRERRFGSAAEFRAAVITLRDLWEAPTDDIVDLAQDYMRPINRALANDTRFSDEELALAEIWVDMAGRRRPNDILVTGWKEAIRNATGNVSSAWGIGLQLLRLRQYREAAKSLRVEAASWGRAELWRQVMVADAAVEMGDAAYQAAAGDLAKTVEAMNRSDWATARDLFAASPLAGAQSAALDSLRSEVNAQLQLLVARQAAADGRWAAAAAAFRVVGEAVDEKTPQIAYADVLRVQDDWANAAGLAEEYGRLAEGALQADALTSRLAGSFHEDLEDGLTKTKAALLERPDSPAVIALIEREAAGRPPVEAQRLLFVALAYGAMPADQEKNLRVAYQKVSDKLEQERLFKEKERAEQAAREKADREKKEAADQKAADDERREEIGKKIHEAVAAGRWADAGKLLASDPSLISSEDREQAHQAFRVAVAGNNSDLAANIAGFLDAIESETAPERAGRLMDQQERQKQTRNKWEADLPAQCQALLAAGAFDDARDLIKYAEPLLPSDSSQANMLRSYSEQLDGFVDVRKRLDAVRKDFEKRASEPDGLEKELKELRELGHRIETLRSWTTDKATEQLRHDVEELRNDAYLARARLKLDEANKSLNVNSLDVAQTRLTEVKTILENVPDTYPGREPLREETKKAEARLEQKRNHGRTWWERFGKYTAILLGAIAVLLAVGLVFLLWSINGERQARSTAEDAQAASEANYNAIATELYILQQPDTQATQEFEDFQTRAAVDATAIAAANSTATRQAADNEGLSTILATVQATPEPLAIDVALTGAAPVAGQSAATVFYDLPATMNLALKPDWSFDLVPDGSLRVVDPGGTVWEMTLVTTALNSDTEIRSAVPASITTGEPTSGSLTIDLAAVPASLPRTPGLYRIGWEARADGDRRSIGASTAEFEIVEPPTVTIKSDATYRNRPEWRANVIVNGGAGQTVEVLGKLNLDAEKTEKDEAPPDPDFLMVRLPGSREIFWLPSWNAEIYNNGDEWNKLINSLPDVTAPAESQTGQ